MERKESEASTDASGRYNPAAAIGTDTDTDTDTDIDVGNRRPTDISVPTSPPKLPVSASRRIGMVGSESLMPKEKNEQDGSLASRSIARR